MLRDAISASGMTPPEHLVQGRWLRFPGIGKGPTNRSGWCRIISPTLAIFGDWSSNMRATWRDDAHEDTDCARAALAQARRREKEFAIAQKARQRQVAADAVEMIEGSFLAKHPYLTAKGFDGVYGLVRNEMLLIPMHDATWYKDVVNVQQIDADGLKRFLTGGRAGGAIHRLGARNARFAVLCEGYATGLSLAEALNLLPGPSQVVVCFSAVNLERIAPLYPAGLVAADNDRSQTGERTAKATGLKWVMPVEIGTDFNDLHQSNGVYAVVERLREFWT